MRQVKKRLSAVTDVFQVGQIGTKPMRALFLLLASLFVALPVMAESSNPMPNFDIKRNCSSEAAEGVDIRSTMADCVQDEVNAKKQLDQEWSKLESNLKRECVAESAIGGDQSYVELITCLEMSSPQWNGDQTVGQAPSIAGRH